jgi:hypothetical protein
MADRRLIISIPIWVRVSGIIALILVGVVVSSMLVGGIGASDHEGGRTMEGMMDGMDHNRGQTGPAANHRRCNSYDRDTRPPHLRAHRGYHLDGRLGR